MFEFREDTTEYEYIEEYSILLSYLCEKFPIETKSKKKHVNIETT